MWPRSRTTRPHRQARRHRQARGSAATTGRRCGTLAQHPWHGGGGNRRQGRGLCRATRSRKASAHHAGREPAYLVRAKAHIVRQGYHLVRRADRGRSVEIRQARITDGEARQRAASRRWTPRSPPGRKQRSPGLSRLAMAGQDRARSQWVVAFQPTSWWDRLICLRYHPAGKWRQQPAQLRQEHPRQALPRRHPSFTGLRSPY
jgi:hypothetical protein